MLRHRSVTRALTALAIVGASLAASAPAASAADATSTAVTPSPATAVWGQSVVLTATVTDTTTPASTPAGSVQFKDGANSLGSPVALVAGAATTPTASLAVGTHTITAIYTPTDASLFITSTSPGTSVMVDRAETTTTLGATPNPTVAGQDATFVAAVTPAPPGAGSPSGTVNFVDRGGPAFDSVALDATGHASTIAFAFAGLYTVDANYLGDPFFKPSSGSVMTRVNRAATATTLTLSPNAVPPGGQSTITATVAVLPPGDVDVNGALQFSVDGAAVGAPIALGGGAIGYQATVTAPTIPGTYAVGVTYSGDADTEPSSASAAQVVTAPAAASAGASSTKVAASQLKAMASTLVTALRLHGLAALASTAQTLTAGPGVVEQKVSSTNAPRGARAAARKPIVLASGRHRFPTAGTGTLRLKLTSAGRRAIRRAKSLKLVIVTRYTPTGGSAVTATQRLTVRAKGRKRARAATASGWQLTGSRVSR